MGVLSGPEITRLVRRTQMNCPAPVPSILIDPFDPELAGPNSYDVHLSSELRVYALHHVRTVDRIWREELGVPADDVLTRAIDNYDGPWVLGVDAHADNPTIPLTIPDGGIWLWPGILYLGATVERTLCCGLVPWLDGRSSVGRLGLSVHVTAGRGDDGWPGRWTCEITAVTHPVRVYPNMRCGQLTYFTLEGERKPYMGKYINQDGPTASRLHLDPHGS
jgi:dCTP deaminase